MFWKTPSNFIEIALRHWRSPVNLLRVFRAPFLKNIVGGLLLYWLRLICRLNEVNLVEENRWKLRYCQYKKDAYIFKVYNEEIILTLVLLSLLQNFDKHSMLSYVVRFWIYLWLMGNVLVYLYSLLFYKL